MQKVRYGLVGFGGIAEARIAKEGFGLDEARFTGNPAAELVGVTDIQQSRRAAAEALGLRWFDSLERSPGRLLDRGGCRDHGQSLALPCRACGAARLVGTAWSRSPSRPAAMRHGNCRGPRLPTG